MWVWMWVGVVTDMGAIVAIALGFAVAASQSTNEVGAQPMDTFADVTLDFLSADASEVCVGVNVDTTLAASTTVLELTVSTPSEELCCWAAFACRLTGSCKSCKCSRFLQAWAPSYQV